MFPLSIDPRRSVPGVVENVDVVIQSDLYLNGISLIKFMGKYFSLGMRQFDILVFKLPDNVTTTKFDFIVFIYRMGDIGSNSNKLQDDKIYSCDY